MSTFKVPITTIRAISPHPNPKVERLAIAQVYDFNVIIRKDQYIVGDKIIYIPIDSILPKKLEEQLFPADSKIKLHNSRIRQVRIQQYPSQGMLLSTTDAINYTGLKELPELETDMSEILGITKYEPPEPKWQGMSSPNLRKNKPLTNPLFHCYHGVENIKWHGELFQNEEVVMQEKQHGSCCRAAYLPTSANTIWKKLLKFFKLLPDYEHTIGSNNVELTNRRNYKGYYGTDVYSAVLKKVDAFNKIKKNEIIFGELIGQGVQKNYDYGHTDHHHFVLFDVKLYNPEDGTYKWLNPEEAELYAKERGFDFVPVLYRGPYNKDLAYSLTKGPSVYCPSQKVREGIVIKSRYNYNDPLMPSNKKAVKWINEDYLDDKSNTDNH